MKNDMLTQYIILAQQGNEEAFAKIYNSFVSQARRIARATCQKEDVDDIVQLCFIKIYNNIKKFSNATCFRKWFSVIVKGECVNHIKKRDEFNDLFKEFDS
jgi:RNA polymerase sigma factor (sigma-70 family)